MLTAALRKLELTDVPVATLTGKLTGVTGLLLEATGCPLETGQHCQIEKADGSWLDAQVVGFRQDITYLMPIQKPVGLMSGARVLAGNEQDQLLIGPSWLGRIVNGMGEPIDGRGRLGGRAATQSPAAECQPADQTARA
ncbi:hypothetical protein [Paludibacterium denitrificans]|uniref:hypothetical protein n=1 Tax=Paludibacterium denitrificans TaxID=2675226 RepID=UPI001E611A3F